MSEPAWTPCGCCPEFWCSIHEAHAWECPCPPVEEWALDPYSCCPSDPTPPSMTSSPDSYRLVVSLERHGEGGTWEPCKGQPGFRFLLTAGSLEDCRAMADQIVLRSCPVAPDSEEASPPA